MPPLIISTWSFGQRGNEAAWPALAAGGDALDAVETVCRVVEQNPEVDSVGYGGLPDRDGAMSLDGCTMLAPNQCGSVCNVRRHLHVVSLARRVMEHTPHVMLAGDAADDFADQQGFERQELCTPDARLAWERWKMTAEEIDQSADSALAPAIPVDRAAGGRLFEGLAAASPGESQWKHHDTISTLAIDWRGVLAGACSTSGTPFKTPGRVGDSPIIGHGLYVDPTAGAAAATGTGELIMGVCGSFLVVELMRGGASPVEAIETALRRIVCSYELRPTHQVAVIAMTPQGQWASGALRAGYRTSVRIESINEARSPDFVLLNDERDVTP